MGLVRMMNDSRTQPCLEQKIKHMMSSVSHGYVDMELMFQTITVSLKNKAVVVIYVVKNQNQNEH